MGTPRTVTVIVVVADISPSHPIGIGISTLAVTVSVSVTVVAVAVPVHGPARTTLFAALTAPISAVPTPTPTPRSAPTAPVLLSAAFSTLVRASSCSSYTAPSTPYPCPYSTLLILLLCRP